MILSVHDANQCCRWIVYRRSYSWSNDKPRVGAVNYDAISCVDEAIPIHQLGQVACFQVSKRVKPLPICSKAEPKTLCLVK